MPVEFEFQVRKDFHFLTAFAQRFNTKVENSRVYLPEMLGIGYIQQVLLDGLSLFIHNYKLKQEFVLIRQPTLTNDVITMKFDRSKFILKYNPQTDDPFVDRVTDWEVEIGTCNVKAELRVPANQQINLIIIGSTRENLLKLLEPGDVGSSILGLVKDHPSFMIHEVMTPEMGSTLKQLIQINSSTQMPTLLYRAKTQELIYHLFKKLFKYSFDRAQKIKPPDAEKIYRVRAAILIDLSKCPRLPELAKLSGMGISKLKTLFSQVFGKSIYDYFQSVRMMEAANLLNTLTVSETGYKLGFTNLSHFTRLFERHHQMKPKHFKHRLTETSRVALAVPSLLISD